MQGSAVTRRRGGQVAACSHCGLYISHTNQTQTISAKSVNKGNHVPEKTEFTTYGIRTRQRPHGSVAQPHATEPRASARQLTIVNWFLLARQHQLTGLQPREWAVFNTEINVNLATHPGSIERLAPLSPLPPDLHP
ncbi:hypothetical protein TMatcc_002392 [Talaromyces marneffei ATCC 18224]